MTPTHTAFMSERDLLRFAAQNRDRRFEIVGGKVVYLPETGILHGIIAGNVYDVLHRFAALHKLGHVFTSGLTFVLLRSNTGIHDTRMPDGSFIRAGRLTRDTDLDLPFPGAPDLAIEVMAPNNTADQLLARIRDYFIYGTEQVWVLYPEQRELHQHVRGELVIHVYTATEMFNAEPLFPGLSLSIADLFALPDWSN